MLRHSNQQETDGSQSEMIEPPKMIISIVNFIDYGRDLFVDENYLQKIISEQEVSLAAIEHIKKTTRLAGNHQNASLALLELLKIIEMHKSNAKLLHANIISTLGNHDLTLHFLGKIFSYLLTRTDLVSTKEEAPSPTIENKSTVSMISGAARGLWHSVSTTAQYVTYKSYYSPEWQHTMGSIRQIALAKLKAELVELDDLMDKIKFLEAAKKMPLFSEHQSNSPLTGAFGDTNAIKEINKLLDEINASVNSIKLIY